MRLPRCRWANSSCSRWAAGLSHEMKPSLLAQEAAWASKQRAEANVTEEPMRHWKREVQRTAFPARLFLLLLVYSSVCISAAADQSQSPDARSRKQLLWLVEKRNSWSIHSAFCFPPWSVSFPPLSPQQCLSSLCVCVCVCLVLTFCLWFGFQALGSRAQSVLILYCGCSETHAERTAAFS